MVEFSLGALTFDLTRCFGSFLSSFLGEDQQWIFSVRCSNKQGLKRPGGAARQRQSSSPDVAKRRRGPPHFFIQGKSLLFSPPRSPVCPLNNQHQRLPHRDDLHTASKEQRSRALVKCDATTCKTSIGSESKTGGGGVDSGGSGKDSWTTRARSRLGSSRDEEEGEEEDGDGEGLLMAVRRERGESRGTRRKAPRCRSLKERRKRKMKRGF